MKKAWLQPEAFRMAYNNTNKGESTISKEELKIKSKALFK
jgi:hypothetical protein